MMDEETRRYHEEEDREEERQSFYYDWLSDNKSRLITDFIDSQEEAFNIFCKEEFNTRDE
jgi:hypothetical protein